MIGRVIYGAAFVVLLPLALALWAMRLDALLRLPEVPASLALPGIAAVALGTALVGSAWWTLARRAGGLPMNAFPPPLFTRAGPYALLDDPIYVGAVLIAAGVSLAARSAAGLWVVTPTLAACAVALVWGHERLDLARRFGARPPAWLHLAPEADRAPTLGERLWTWTHLLAVWAVLYELVGHLPVPHAFSVWLSFERGAPVDVRAEVPYASVYGMVLAAPFFVRSASALRRLVRIGQVGCLVGFTVYLVVPAIAPPRPFEGDGVLAALLRMERADGLAGRAAFPSFHVFWTLWVLRAAWATRLRFAAAAWALVAVAACWLTGMHALVDLVGGALLFAFAALAPRLWSAAMRAAERLANGWVEWRIGPVRVINHGFFAAVASGAGALVVLALLGPGHALAMVAIAAASLVSAGLWGQALVGSRTLLRPFGYFGSALGLGAAFALAAALGHGVWPAAAAVATAAPLAQALGRLRCLVQGCCHGAPCRMEHGIRVTHPRSRIVFVSGLAGVPILPTPLVSIAANLVILPLLLRLWWIEAPAALILGAYLVLQGIARFVEEGHRGEVQTQRVGPFRVYQVLSAAMVLAGVAVSSVASPAVVWAPGLGNADVGAAALVAALHLFAMGVDFPASNRRFSRLV